MTGRELHGAGEQAQSQGVVDAQRTEYDTNHNKDDEGKEGLTAHVGCPHLAYL